MTDVSDTIEYYKELLLSQWGNASNARATVGLLCEHAICDLVPLAVRDAFDIDTAIGDQLDILGEYIGFSRRVEIIIERTYFNFDDYGDPDTDAIGMTDYGDPLVNQNSVFYRYIYNEKSFSDLADDEYRILLKLKIVLNHSDNTLYSAQNTLDLFFGNSILLYDSKDMTIAYYVGATTNYVLQIAMQEDLLPRPMGVAISGVFLVSDPTAVFGFQDYAHANGNLEGFADYADGWNDMQWLSYNDKL
jgi:hypothetical protein